MNYYIISGELSGDLYGSKLIKSLRKYDTNAVFTCWGGDYMKKAGGHMVRDLDQLSFIGFFELLKHSFTIFSNYTFAKKHIKSASPDAIILIDYPGFNLRIAKYAKSLQIPVFWFIAPQTWAWKKNRVYKMKKYIDKLFVALPFELEYFSNFNIETYYYGHPILELLEKQKEINTLGKPIIALMPGSRKQEVQKMLPEMLKLIDYFRDYHFIIGGVNNIDLLFYKKIIKNHNVKLVINQTYKLMSVSSAAIVTSGTISLEAAICNLPQVVCYKTSFISFSIAKRLIKSKYISLVNIILNRSVVDELIQQDFNSENLIFSLEKNLNKNNIKNLQENYQELIHKLNKKFSFNDLAKDMLLFCKKN